MSKSRKTKHYLGYAVGAFAIGSLAFYNFTYSDEHDDQEQDEEQDDELFIMHDLAREYWLEGGVGYCGSEMRPNFKVVKEEARKGNALAALRLAQVYASGFWGVEKSDETSFEWYLLAAKGGVEVAQIKVGIAYERGVGIEENIDEAMKWFEKAAASGKHPDLKTKIEEYRKQQAGE